MCVGKLYMPAYPILMSVYRIHMTMYRIHMTVHLYNNFLYQVSLSLTTHRLFEFPPFYFNLRSISSGKKISEVFSLLLVMPFMQSNGIICFSLAKGNNAA